MKTVIQGNTGFSSGVFFIVLFLLVLISVALPVQAAPLCDRPSFTLALDVGHSKTRPGAISARGHGEWLFNQGLARVVYPRLVQAGFQVLLINPAGKDIGLKDRTRKAKEAGADLFLSLHHDSVQPQFLSSWTVDGKKRHFTRDIAGFSVFISRRNKDWEASRAFGRLLGGQMRAAGFTPSPHHAAPIKGENRPFLDPERGLYRFDDLIVLHSAAMPAALLEAGVIVNPDEEQTLTRPGTRDRMADAILYALDSYCARLHP